MARKKISKIREISDAPPVEIKYFISDENRINLRHFLHGLKIFFLDDNENVCNKIDKIIKDLKLDDGE